jgi:hypothetical protein
MNRTIDPGILYLGTPVVLIRLHNEEKSLNPTLMSSA